MFLRTAGYASRFPSASWFAKPGLTANSFLSYPAPAPKLVASSPHFFLILVGPFYCSRLHFLLPRRLAKRASHFLLPPLASLVPPSKFLARAWTSGSQAVFSPKNPKPPSKANGSPTVAETKCLPSPGGEKPRTIAPLSLCACAVR